MEDGFGLFYAGRINGIHGEPESGKSWVAWITVAQLLASGGSVLYVDLEDSERGAVERLLALGVEREYALGENFGYIRPEEALGMNGAQPFRDWAELLVRDPPWDLVVIDSTGEAMALEGLDPLDNKDSSYWMRRALRPALERGTAVLLLDHVTKNTETRGKWAIGAQQKRAMIRGASYIVECRQPFGRGLQGEAVLTVVKDSPGAIRAQRGGNVVAARLKLLSDAETGRVTYHLGVPVAQHTFVLDRLKAFLLVNPGASKRRLRELSNSDLIDELVEKAVSEGQIRVEITGTAHAHFWVSD